MENGFDEIWEFLRKKRMEEEMSVETAAGRIEKRLLQIYEDSIN